MTDESVCHLHVTSSKSCFSGGAASLLPFLRPAAGGTAACRKPPEEWRKVLRSLGTTAPVCVLLPLAVHGPIRSLLHSRVLSYQERQLLATRAPLMDYFMKPAFQSGQGDSLSNMLTLLRAMLKVRPIIQALATSKIAHL